MNSKSTFNPNITYLPNKTLEHSAFMYGILLIRISLLYFAVEGSYAFFKRKYEDEVLTLKKEAVTINLYYIINLFLFIDFFLNALLFMFLKYVSQKYHGPYSSMLVTSFSWHYIISMLIIVLLGFLTINMIYSDDFHIENDGLRAINSIRSILLYVGIIISLLPFFLIGLWRSCVIDVTDKRIQQEKIKKDLIKASTYNK